MSAWHRFAIAIFALFVCTFAYPFNYCAAPVPQSQQHVVDANLIQVTLLTRHGDRAPANVMPNENITWLCGTSDVAALVSPSLPTGD